VRRWRNLLVRRGRFWVPPPRPAAVPAHLVAAFIQQADRRLAGPRRGRFFPRTYPGAVAAPAPVLVPPLARQPGRRFPRAPRGQFLPLPPQSPGVPPPLMRQGARRALRLPGFRRGQFLAMPPASAPAAQAPAWVAPSLRQARRWLPPRRRVTVPPIPVSAAVAPASLSRRPSRLARVPRGQFFPVRPVPTAPGAPGPLVPPHLRQRRAQPLRIPRGHRADPPWQGAAAPPPAAIPAQFIRQGAARARLPRRGCLFPVPAQRPAASPAPVMPFLRAAGHRPRRAPRPRRGCWYSPPWKGAPPPPFTVGALTAADTGSAVLAAGSASSQLTAATAPGSAITAATQRTGGPS
jgi:hypothetical protein